MFVERRYPARVLAEVGNGLEAVKAAEQECPDLVILDIAMPVMNGFVAARRIKARWPEVPIIFISGNTDAGSIREAFRCGAHACLSKLTFAAELIPTIERVLCAEPHPA